MQAGAPLMMRSEFPKLSVFSLACLSKVFARSSGFPKLLFIITNSSISLYIDSK